VSTNRDFLRKAMHHPPFIAGTHNTSLVADLATA
jgi:acetyl/propionyl-CoA carboxylase alpha subunit